MWNLDQWKAQRRVDHQHINLGLVSFNRRIQPFQGPQHLRHFDPFVDDCTRLPLGPLQKAGALGRLMQQLLLYTTAFPVVTPQNQRYLTPVTTLLAQVRQELNLVWGALYSNAREADLLALINGHNLVAKTVNLNVFFVEAVNANTNAAAIDAEVDRQIQAANGLASYMAANLRLVRSNANVTILSMRANNAANPILTPNGNFREDARSVWELIQELDSQVGLAGTVDLVMVDNFSGNDVQGFTCRMSGLYSNIQPSHRPIVMVRMTPALMNNGAPSPTHATTLAHEMGHALTDTADHSHDAGDLMSSGNIRGAVDRLSDAEKAWFRQNPFTV